VTPRAPILHPLQCSGLPPALLAPMPCPIRRAHRFTSSSKSPTVRTCSVTGRMAGRCSQTCCRSTWVATQSRSRRTAIVVDDGIAAGSTMCMAITALRGHDTPRIVIAAPTAHRGSLEVGAGSVEAIHCANFRGGFALAVADACRRWSDVTDDEAVKTLECGGGRRSTPPAPFAAVSTMEPAVHSRAQHAQGNGWTNPHEEPRPRNCGSIP
jgi:hypothetical protein